LLLPHGTSSELLLAGFEEVIRPAITEVLVKAFLAAQLGKTILTAQAFENDPDILFGSLPFGPSPRLT